MPAENIELLIEFTHDDDPRARAMAVAGLAKLADARGFAPVLVCLFDPVDEVRAAAATALGIFGDDRAFEALVECLGDPNERGELRLVAWPDSHDALPRQALRGRGRQ